MSGDQAPVVIVGAGVAGARCAEALRGGGHTGGIVVFGDEAHGP
jgi:3-phenylpropionate/trans-cinnamate dioxygenase ferredoxin reductase component